MCRLLGGFSLTEYSPLQAMKENKTPVIFFHGEADDFVPPEMSVKNHEACVAEKQLVTVEKAGHGLCYLVDRERCEQLIGEFIDKNLRVK